MFLSWFVMGSCQGVANQINSWLILWELRLHFPHATPFNWTEIVFWVDTWDSSRLAVKFANARFANSFCAGWSWLWLLTNISPLWRQGACHLPKWLHSSRVPEPDLSEPMSHQLCHVEASLGPPSNVPGHTLTNTLPIAELGWKMKYSEKSLKWTATCSFLFSQKSDGKFCLKLTICFGSSLSWL